MSALPVVTGPGEIESCPCRGETRGVETITGTPAEVEAWSCGACGTDWAVTVVNPHPRQFLDQLAADVAARAVLREITTLAGQADTLTDGQMRARLIGCLVRLDQICRRSAAPGFPAGYRPDNEVPGTSPVPPHTPDTPASREKGAGDE
jgi:hypothetical protein